MKKKATRKEARKKERRSKKAVKRPVASKAVVEQPVVAQTKAAKGTKATDGPLKLALSKKAQLKRLEGASISASSSSTKATKAKAKDSKDRPSKLGQGSKYGALLQSGSSGDAFIDKEDKEIKRLEKLMGLSGKSRKKMESKLNKEFRDYEGIGGNFGSFLMQLDDLEAYVQGKSKVGVFAGDNEVGGGDSDVEEAGPGLLGAHILDDDEQEESDVDDDMDVSSEDEDTDDDGDGDQAPQLVGDGDEEDSYGSAVDADASDTEDEGEQVYYSSSSSASGDDSGSESDSGYEFDHADRLGDMERGEHYSESASQSQSQSEPESTSGSESDSGNESGEGSQSGSDSDSDSDMDADERRAKHARKADEEAEWAQHAYRPASGEDIYGRCTAAAGDGGTKPGKYIPPAMRAKMAAAAAKASDCGAARGEADDGATASSSSSSSVNTNTAEARALKKQMNGTLNRLSDSSKDATLNALCALFNNNSRTVCCHLFKDALFATCASETQIMASLVPMYAAMVAGLHFAVSTDVGAFMIEALAETLHRATTASTSTKGEHELISNKAAGNLFMLLLHLYGLRVLHHQMIVDFLRMFSGAGAEGGDDDDCGALKEAHLELVHAAVEHCGPTLRADDPVALKDVITALSGRLRALVEGEGERGLAARAQFFLEALTDLKNNRSRRTQSAALETQTRLRKWLGAVKSGGRSISHASSAKVTLLRISLRDILDVGKKGRWWRAGASWAGRSAADVEQISAVKSSNTAIAAAVAAGSKEERRLLKLADKMSMNTPLRRSIFVVLMSSTDVHDALERLLRMDLKGKDDREIARVVTECCAQEKTYNAFYGTVSGLLCDHNRQHKTTFQFCVWDSLKLMVESSVPPRRVMNLARFLAHLVAGFHLPMAVLKTLEVSDLPNPHQLFLATFFLGLFSSGMDDGAFAAAMDRVASSPDFESVREGLLLYLQRDMKKFPKGLAPEKLALVKKRRKFAIRTFEKMGIIQMVRGEEG